MSNVRVVEGDLSVDMYIAATNSQVVGVDIETDGLDFRGKIGVVTVYDFGTDNAEIVRINETYPTRLKTLLQLEPIMKLFHYAVFDLSFLANSFGIHARNVACTRLAAKLYDPEKKLYTSHSLQNLLKDALDVSIPKGYAVSDWFVEPTEAQIEYAVNDTKYLLPLYLKLRSGLYVKDRYVLYRAACQYLPYHVDLRLMGIETEKDTLFSR